MRKGTDQVGNPGWVRPPQVHARRFVVGQQVRTQRLAGQQVHAAAHGGRVRQSPRAERGPFVPGFTAGGPESSP